MSKKAPDHKRTGRPTLYTPALGTRICDLLSNGESLRKACARRGMPRRETVFAWLLREDMEEFRNQYARARATQAESFAEDIVEISDTEPDPNRARVRIDARKWTASKLLPKKYGERMALEGADGGPAVFRVVIEEAVPPDGDS